MVEIVEVNKAPSHNLNAPNLLEVLVVLVRQVKESVKPVGPPHPLTPQVRRQIIHANLTILVKQIGRDGVGPFTVARSFGGKRCLLVCVNIGGNLCERWRIRRPTPTVRVKEDLVDVDGCLAKNVMKPVPGAGSSSSLSNLPLGRKI